MVVRGGEVLLVHRPAYDDWSLPKGKAKASESDEECAVREVEEETGLRCTAGREVAVTEYVDAHGKLLTFYEKNWGAWDAGQPLKFRTAQLTSAYQKIKEQIISAGKQLDQQYKAMAE